ncbi:MAG TPA: hypothetical protein VNU66_04985 [Mycobacteriales bacterium]|nr:hypothetical protein [Mycobacteriales bacterium]
MPHLLLALLAWLLTSTAAGLLATSMCRAGALEDRAREARRP